MANAATAKPKSKLVILAAVGALVLTAGGLGGAWALGLFGGGAAPAAPNAAPSGDAGGEANDKPAEPNARQAAKADDPTFVDLPQLLVNLVSEDGGSRFLKLSLAVEVHDERTAERIDKLSPRIVDSFQLYLRTLTPGELRGPGSMFRLKEDLHVRLQEAIAPAEVEDVLFKEMLVQ